MKWNLTRWDAMQLAGAAVIVAGLWQWSPPTATIMGGLFILGIGILGDYTHGRKK